MISHQEFLNSKIALALAQQIVEVARSLHQRNCLAAADGNISALWNDIVLITPSGVSKAAISPQDICGIDLQNNILWGSPSGERLMHLEVYNRCPKAHAVVHAHPPTAIAWSISRPDLQELPSDSMSEVILAAGKIPFAPYARPGTAEMGKVLVPFLPQHRAMILSRHGALTWGEDLAEAHRGMERIEHVSQILLSAEKLGGAKPLPAAEIEALHQMRKSMGERLF